MLVDSAIKYLIFWATMFMTSALGIVRLLSDFHNAHDSGWYFVPFSILYFGFVLLNALSISRGIGAYQILRELSISGRLGNEIREKALRGTIIDVILSVPQGETRELSRFLWVIPVILFPKNKTSFMCFRARGD